MSIETKFQYSKDSKILNEIGCLKVGNTKINSKIFSEISAKSI